MEEIGYLLVFRKNGTPPVSESIATCCDCVCATIAVSAPALPVLGKFCFVLFSIKKIGYVTTGPKAL